MRPIEMFRVCLRCCDSNNLFNSLTFPDNTFLSMMTMVAGLEVLISGSYCIICGHVRERYGHSSSTSSPLYLSLSLRCPLFFPPLWYTQCSSCLHSSAGTVALWSRGKGEGWLPARTAGAVRGRIQHRPRAPLICSAPGTVT